LFCFHNWVINQLDKKEVKHRSCPKIGPILRQLGHGFQKTLRSLIKKHSHLLLAR